MQKKKIYNTHNQLYKTTVRFKAKVADILHPTVEESSLSLMKRYRPLNRQI